MGDEDLSPQQRLELGAKFVASAPPGEFNEVFKAVSTLVDNSEMINGIAPAMRQNYNTDQMVVADAPDGSHKIVIAKCAEIDAEHYIDPVAKQVVTFNHETLTASDPRPLEAGESVDDLEGLRTAAQDSLAKYMTASYIKDAAVGVFARGGQDLSIAVSGAKFSPNNFWNGRWRSSFIVSVDGGQTGASIKGTIKVIVHYFEGGNVQLTSSKNVDGQLAFSGADDFGAKLAAFMKKTEDEYQTALTENYTSMSEGTFKSLRRKLPINGQKFQWDKLQVHSLAGSLQNR
jgi:capping protein alpha